MNWLDGMGIDKIAHIGVYAIWAAFYVLSLKDESSLPLRRIGIGLVAMIFFGLGIEALQWQFAQGRYFEWLDVIANALGVLLGSLVIFRILKRSGSWN